MEKKQRKRNFTMMGEEDEVVGSAAWLSQFDERDFEASQILLDLQSGLMPRPPAAAAEWELERGGGEKNRIPFTVVWGRKKLLASKTRRAAVGTAAAPAAYPSQRVKAAAQATSPDTPLNINRHSSESEDFSPPPNQQPAKKKRKELARDLQELNDCREKLRKEVENVSAYYKELLASNKMWKQTKQMVEKSNSEIKNCSKFGVRSGQLYLETQHQRPFLLNNPNPNPTARIEPQEQFQLQQYHHQQGPQLYGQGPSILPMGRLSSMIGPLPKQIIAQSQAMEQDRARKRAEEARKRRKMLIQERQQRLPKAK